MTKALFVSIFIHFSLGFALFYKMSEPPRSGASRVQILIVSSSKTGAQTNNKKKARSAKVKSKKIDSVPQKANNQGPVSDINQVKTLSRQFKILPQDLLYPKPSKVLGEQGRVKVLVEFNTQGMSQKAQIVESSGFSELDRAALSNAKSLVLSPKPKKIFVENITYDFRLNE